MARSERPPSTPSPQSATSQNGDGSTPATSGSSPDPRLIDRTKDVGESDIKTGIGASLSLLGNYVPLGCICFENSTTQQDEFVARQWTEIHDSPLATSTIPDLHSSLKTLLQSQRVRIRCRQSFESPEISVLRVYLLAADVGQEFIRALNKNSRNALQLILENLDTNSTVWQRHENGASIQKFDLWATKEEGSLFYMFNKLPSPAPSTACVGEKYNREALEDILDPLYMVPGLKTPLYPYQRRSAGLMLQRESVLQRQLDPSIEPRTAPDGSTYYYGPRSLSFLRDPIYFDSCRGGILAESMGLGKTVIVLALALSTKSHLPRVPSPHDLPSVRSHVGSLSDMVVSSIRKKSVPYKIEFDRIRQAYGNDMINCVRKIEATPLTYDIQPETTRWGRNNILPPPRRVTLASTTLIVVPPNLCKQWQSEISKHVEEGALNILVMEDLKKTLPLPNELRMYDIILFSRNRYDREIRDGSDDKGRRMGITQRDCRCPYVGATRIRDCHCIQVDDLYVSPLKHIHFKRFIIDEGHSFSNNKSTAVTVSSKLVTADHRWVVSGTPAKDLLGVEVDMAATSEDSEWEASETNENRTSALEQRRDFNQKEDTTGAIHSLASLATHFLMIEPWYLKDAKRTRTDWDECMYRHENIQKRTFSGFSSSFRRTLEAMVVKTQPEDVERDIVLPPLTHDIIRLEPSFFDKVTANLFALVLTANAVTSERSDQDYLFHKNNQKARNELLSKNLRQSPFVWTGFSESDVTATIKVCNSYLEKEDTTCTAEDRQLLTNVVHHAELVLGSKGWTSMTRAHELGLFIEDWPGNSAPHWKFDKGCSPLLTGMTQLLEAQKHVHTRAGTVDPGEGLSGAGIKATAPAKREIIKIEATIREQNKQALAQAGIPASSLRSQPSLRRGPLNRASPQKSPIKVCPNVNIQSSSADDTTQNETGSSTPVSSSTPSRKRKQTEPLILPDLPSTSPFLQSQIIGTTSAKLSYLVSQIMRYQNEEKIIVFYDGDNIAYYIAQMLEILHVKHEIYAKTLSSHQKAEYVVRFNQELADRVLLMDVNHAAHGLNICSASRIYFVNPVCRPNVEAQAIKRAHRIGQTRKVTVETLVLKGTIEEQMLERSKRMTRTEHLDARMLEDDGGVRDIIQSAEPISIQQYEKTGYGQMAPLDVPQQLWGREGWRDAIGAIRPEDARPPETDEPAAKRAKLTSEAVAGTTQQPMPIFVDRTEPNRERVVMGDDHGHPMAGHWNVDGHGVRSSSSKTMRFAV